VWQGDREGRALSQPGVDPDAAAVMFDDLFADGQANARSLVLIAGDQALEDAKGSVMVGRCDADDPVLAGLGQGNFDFGRLFGPAVFDGIADQVLKQPHPFGMIAPDLGKKSWTDDLCRGLGNGHAKVLQAVA